MNTDTKVNMDFGFANILTIIFVVLKLVGVIDWAWVWVLSPIWISFIIFLVLVLIVIILRILR